MNQKRFFFRTTLAYSSRCAWQLKKCCSNNLIFLQKNITLNTMCVISTVLNKLLNYVFHGLIDDEFFANGVLKTTIRSSCKNQFSALIAVRMTRLVFVCGQCLKQAQNILVVRTLLKINRSQHVIDKKTLKYKMTKSLPFLYIFHVQVKKTNFLSNLNK